MNWGILLVVGIATAALLSALGVSRSLWTIAGAALMLAGLMAEGETLLSDPSGHIERGYQNLPEKLRLLGADIERLDDYPV